MIVGATTIDVKFQPGKTRAMIDRALEAGMMNVGRNLSKFIGSSMKAGNGRPSAPGTPPNVQSGDLRSSLDWIYRRDGERHAVKVYAGGDLAPYARVHELGGTIYAKGNALTIPVNDAAKQASRKSLSARNIPGLFLVNRPGGRGLLAKRSPGHNGGLDVWFILRKSVTLPARPFMRPGLDRARESIVPWIIAGARRAGVRV